MTDDIARDDEALMLRAQGKSFAAIAKLLGYDRAHEANAAFNRALRRKPAAEQATLRDQELARLDAMPAGIRARSSVDHEETVRKLQTVERLRASTGTRGSPQSLHSAHGAGRSGGPPGASERDPQSALRVRPTLTR